MCNTWNFTPTLKVWAVNWAGCRRRRRRCSIMLWTSHYAFSVFNGGLQSINNQEKIIFNCYFSSFSASVCWWCSSAVTAVFSRSRAVELFHYGSKISQSTFPNKKVSKKFESKREKYPSIDEKIMKYYYVKQNFVEDYLLNKYWNQWKF